MDIELERRRAPTARALADLQQLRIAHLVIRVTTPPPHCCGVPVSRRVFGFTVIVTIRVGILVLVMMIVVVDGGQLGSR